MKEIIADAITDTLQGFGIEAPLIVVEAPDDLARGDYAAPLFAVAKQAGKNPKELAETIAADLHKNLPQGVSKVEAAGGFVNFFLSSKYLAEVTKAAVEDTPYFGCGKLFAGEKVMVEYTDPNPFKEFHIGHLMSNATGETISRLIEFQGAEVYRANYQGDVGLHVAKAIWGKIQKPELPWGEAYAFGAQSYEDNPEAKAEIDSINKKLFEKSDEQLNALYKEGREASLERFETLYKILGTKFAHYFFEGEMVVPGMQLVEEYQKHGVFETSDGAVVFKGEKHDLHTRVFITKSGLPTYETKELGLAQTKAKLWPADRSITITANEQDAYFRVVLAAMQEIDERGGNLRSAHIDHISHGLMRFASGKMSSRLGNVVTGESLIGSMKELALEKMAGRDFDDAEKNKIAEQVAIAAIKFSILKQKVGKDIIFDPAAALSFEGDSGPYLQYAHTRAASILKKAGAVSAAPTSSAPHLLERLVAQFPDVALRAAEEVAPQLVVSYLVNLASAFNSFYASEKIIGSENESQLLAIVLAVKTVLKNGLWLLSIEALDEM